MSLSLNRAGLSPVFLGTLMWVGSPGFVQLLCLPPWHHAHTCPAPQFCLLTQGQQTSDISRGYSRVFQVLWEGTQPSLQLSVFSPTESLHLYTEHVSFRRRKHPVFKFQLQNPVPVPSWNPCLSLSESLLGSDNRTCGKVQTSTLLVSEDRQL